MADADITLRDIIVHMQGMEKRLTSKIGSLEGRIDNVDRRMDGLDGRLDRMEKNLSRQIQGIDERLDAIEIEQLPKRVRRLEKAAGFV